MGRTRRQELFWVGLIVLCIALFVMQRTREPSAAPVGSYDRQSMDRLVKQSWKSTSADPNANIVTGSVMPRPRPAQAVRADAPQTGVKSQAAQKYFVSFGRYSSIDLATQRYLDVVARSPEQSPDDLVTIETFQTREGVQHRVRMGSFETAWSARASCLKAGFKDDGCRVLPMN